MYPLTHTLSFTNRNKLRSGKKIRRHPASAAATPWLIQHFATWCSLNFHRSMNRTTMTVVLRCLWEGIVTQAAKSSLVFTFAGKHKGRKEGCNVLCHHGVSWRPRKQMFVPRFITRGRSGAQTEMVKSNSLLLLQLTKGICAS